MGIEQARETIPKRTQRHTRSAVMPLVRQYKGDRVFQTTRLTGMWCTDTMDRHVKYLYGNQYTQVFSNGTYFSEIYPISKKPDTGQALKTFLIELGVP